MATIVMRVCDKHQADGQEVEARLLTYYDPLTGKPVEIDLCEQDAVAVAEGLSWFSEMLAKFGTVARPRQGQLIETEAGELPCLHPDCKLTWRTKGSRQQHVTRAHPELADPCDYCDKRSLNLEQHIRQEHKDKMGEWRAKLAA